MKIDLSKRGVNLSRLTPKQRLFCLEMMASNLENPGKCAEAAGYSKKTSPQMAAKLLKDPRIKALLGKFQYDREERTKLTSDDIWRYLHVTLNYNPLDLFEPGEDGWYITDLAEIPPEIGRLVEEVEVHEKTDREGNLHRRLKIKLVSKSAALGIAARHAIPPPVQKHEMMVVQVGTEYLAGGDYLSSENIIDAQLSQLEKQGDESKEQGGE